MSVSTYIALVTFVATLISWYLTRNFNYWKKRSVVGPKPNFFFGNLKDVVLHKKSINIQYHELYDAYPNEKVVGIYRLSTPLMVVRDLDLIQNIFIKDFNNFVDRGTEEFGKRGMSQNLFVTSGDNWRVLRTRFSPIFSSGKLKNMFYLLNDRGDHFLDYIGNALKKSTEQDTYPIVQMYTISTISACAFGIDIDLNNFDKEMYAKIDNLIFTTPYLSEIHFMFPGIVGNLNIDVFPKFITNYFNELVQSVVRQRNGKPINRKDFIDLLLELRNAGEVKGPKKHESEQDKLLTITDELLGAQAFVFYAGGYETSATTMSFLLHELALHPDIQDRVFNEITEVIAQNDNKLTYDCLKDMVYLQQAFDETLRMYPVVDPLHRRAKAPYKVPGSDLVIEKNTACYISVRGIHYDEKYYPDPHKFDPDRFSPENVKSRHPCTYMPFGLGSRNCIGMRFAKVQSMVCMVKLLQNYRVVPIAATTRDFVYDGARNILRSKKENPLKFVPRNNSSS